MTLDAVKDKENYKKYLHEYKRLIQRKRRIDEVTQEKAHACVQILGESKGNIY